jgi:GntR family transcriptional repressor for pyruvate dehydrogenase complex
VRSEIPADRGGEMIVNPLRRRSLVDDAIEQLKELIVVGELRPGQKLLSERILCERLGVSRPTLREAIRALCAIGVLEARQGDGTYVTDLLPETIAQPFAFLLAAHEGVLEDLFAVRLSLESTAAELCAERISEEALEKLREELRALEVTKDDYEQFVALDIEFHRIIHVESHNPLLISLLDSIAVLSRASRLVSVRRPGVQDSTLREHRVIIMALSNHDRDGARRAMVAHLQDVRHALHERPET